jgi:hypothetical protein
MYIFESAGICMRQMRLEGSRDNVGILMLTLYVTIEDYGPISDREAERWRFPFQVFNYLLFNVARRVDSSVKMPKRDTAEAADHKLCLCKSGINS